jgi:ribosomal protein S1
MTHKIDILSLDDLDGSVVDLMVKLAGYIKEHPQAYIRTERRAESLLNGDTVMCNYIHVEYVTNSKPDLRVEDIARKFAKGLTQ